MNVTKRRQIWLVVWVVLALVAGHLGSGRAARQAADETPAIHVAGDPRGGGSGGSGGVGGGAGGGGGGSW